MKTIELLDREGNVLFWNFGTNNSYENTVRLAILNGVDLHKVSAQHLDISDSIDLAKAVISNLK